MNHLYDNWPLYIGAALLALLIWAMTASDAKKFAPEAYDAWCKIERRTDISYEEWKTARSAGLIPESNRFESSAVFVPVVVR